MVHFFGQGNTSPEPNNPDLVAFEVGEDCLVTEICATIITFTFQAADIDIPYDVTLYLSRPTPGSENYDPLTATAVTVTVTVPANQTRAYFRQSLDNPLQLKQGDLIAFRAAASGATITFYRATASLTCA
jgi:hypothetical protein